VLTGGNDALCDAEALHDLCHIVMLDLKIGGDLSWRDGDVVLSVRKLIDLLNYHVIDVESARKSGKVPKQILGRWDKN